MRIVHAIREAERRSSGEIRVFVESKVKGDILARAKKVFEKMGMTRTRQRNGVLLYFAVSDRAFSVLGDRGIHERVGDPLWKQITDSLSADFAKGEFAAGLERGVQQVGSALAKYFPFSATDKNELPDDIEKGRR